ncbi:MAG TPA: O-antigen ligase family protein [Bryobacteraceae bacterium]|nr:O-antigen ligase family protein [Bryobacteraceae bacterium]
MVPPPFLARLSLWLAIASSVIILFSIAASQICLALALGILLLSGLPLRWPRVSIPLGAFLGWVLIALAFSPDPRQGLAQVRKMLVFAMLLIVYSSVRRIAEAKWLVLAWIGAGTFTAGKGLLQYAADVAGARASHRNFYDYYIADRIRGFMSHWMTFSGQELYVLLLAAAFLLFAGRSPRLRWPVLACSLVVGLALVLSDTRSIWAAAVTGLFYLLWVWDKRAAIAMPVILALGVLAAPAEVKQRVHSITSPTKITDSNEHRRIVFRTGWEMIKAHPLVGVGPEMIRKPEVFHAYLPKDIPLPLPDGFYEHLHNIYIHYAAECGIPATVALVAAFGLALWDFRRAIVALPPGPSDRRFLLHGAIACILGTMVAGMLEKNLGDTEVLTMYLVILCLGYLAVKPADIIDISNP